VAVLDVVVELEVDTVDVEQDAISVAVNNKKHEATPINLFFIISPSCNYEKTRF